VRDRFFSAISIVRPDGWVASDSLELIAPDRRVHLRVSSEDLAVEDTLEDYVRRYASLMADRLPGYAAEHEKAAKLFGGRDAVVCRYTWSPRDRPPITQVQAYCLEGGRGFVATVTMPQAFFAELEDVAMRLLGSIALAELAPVHAGVVPLAEDPIVVPSPLDAEARADARAWDAVRPKWHEVAVPA
jgi:hypothetical protein